MASIYDPTNEILLLTALWPNHIKIVQEYNRDLGAQEGMQRVEAGIIKRAYFILKGALGIEPVAHNSTVAEKNKTSTLL